MPFTIVCQDITELSCDAVVNAANTSLQAGGGVCGAIFRRAGKGQLQQACNQLAPIDVGQAVITPGFDLPSRYVIHAVGPIYRGGKQGEQELLTKSYRSVLQLALEYQLTSIAFPLISSGIYSYPKREALAVATGVFREFLVTCPTMQIVLATIDRKTIVPDQQLLSEVITYLATCEWQENSVVDSNDVRSFTPFTGVDATTLAQQANLPPDYLQKRRDVDKIVAVALAVALKMSLTESRSFLGDLGFLLDGKSLFDHIIEFCLSNEILDIFTINELLFYYEQPLLGKGFGNATFN